MNEQEEKKPDNIINNDTSKDNNPARLGSVPCKRLCASERMLITFHTIYRRFVLIIPTTQEHTNIDTHTHSALQCLQV